jgi:hypothetical protein
VELARVASRVERPAEALKALAALKGELDALEEILVHNALAAGWTWKRIAEALGVSKQAAHKKHARRSRGAPDARHAARMVVTGEARQAVYFARREAKALGRSSVDADDLLLGLLRQERTPAARALLSLGVTLASARQRRHRGAAAAPRVPPDGPVPIGLETRRVLEQSLREAVRLGDTRLGVEHLLLALLRDERGSAVGALDALGVSTHAVEERLIEALAKAR